MGAWLQRVHSQLDDQADPVFEGRIIDVTIDRVTLPNGVECDLEVIHHPGGAAAVAVDTKQRVCLLRQYRISVSGWLWELPAGTIDDGEPHLQTAQRELREEARRARCNLASSRGDGELPGSFQRARLSTFGQRS